MTRPPRVVWVLGAGFSVPLGGSTLNELLSVKSFRVVQAKFPELVFVKDTNNQLLRRDALSVYTLYHYGRQFPEGGVVNRVLPTMKGERLWDNAEDFLDYLDVACSPKREHVAKHLEAILAWCRGQMVQNHPLASRLGNWPELEEMRAAARRLVAAECAIIEQPGIADTERWSPYRRWAKMFNRGQHDTVVTFNYDRVLELLKLSERVVQFGQAENAHKGILKLHGSVDWKQRHIEVLFEGGMVVPEGLRFVQAEPDAALRCKDNELCIATPGPTKFSETNDLLRPLWALAAERLGAADVAIFVGYRFPPSDAQAREVILDALAQNQEDRLDVHIVLGPNRSDDVVRLEHLLRYVLERTGRGDARTGPAGKARWYTLTWHPLWAQDFLAVYDPSSLLYPPGRLIDE